MHPDRSDERSARFTAIASAVQGDVLRYARRRAGADDAADVLADTLLVVWRRLDDVPDGAATLPWCYGVARRCLANQRRSGERRLSLVRRLVTERQMGASWSDTDAGLATHDAMDDAADEAADAVREALDELREDDREVLRLWAWEDLTTSEIAAVLEITTNAASVRLHRAKVRLRTRLEAQMPSSEGNRLGVGKDRTTSGHVGDEERYRP